LDKPPARTNLHLAASVKITSARIDTLLARIRVLLGRHGVSANVLFGNMACVFNGIFDSLLFANFPQHLVPENVGVSVDVLFGGQCRIGLTGQLFENVVDLLD
jgi:hypothetical protein